jgi:hypothetical protein
MKFNSILKIVLAPVFMLLAMAVANADVTIKQSGNTLNIRGDKEHDAVTIQAMGFNSVAIAVNNDPPIPFLNVANIKVNMGQGVDTVYVEAIDISGNLDVNLGGDAGDVFDLQDAKVGGNLKVRGVSDGTIRGGKVGKDFSYQAGIPLQMNGTGFTLLADDTLFQGRATIRGNSRFDDIIGLTNCAFMNNLDVRMGGGDDQLFCFEMFVFGNVNFDGGRGLDARMTLGAFVVGGIVKDKGFEILLF